MDEGAIDGSVHGIWTITEKGREILGRDWPSWVPRYSSTTKEAANNGFRDDLRL